MLYFKVGFDSGNGKNFYATPNSRTQNIGNIASESNVGIPGKMIFQMSTLNITLPGKTMHLYYKRCLVRFYIGY